MTYRIAAVAALGVFAIAAGPASAAAPKKNTITAVGGNLYSVNSYGYSNQPDVMFGPYLDGVAQSVYNAAAAD